VAFVTLFLCPLIRDLRRAWQPQARKDKQARHHDLACLGKGDSPGLGKTQARKDKQALKAL